jgi:urease accessory protein
MTVAALLPDNSSGIEPTGDTPWRPTPGAFQRARGCARIRLSADRNGTQLNDLFQQGCLKVRLPRPQCRGEVDVALINTAGGLTGGDAVDVDVHLDHGARATVTTPGCDRVYRSLGGDAVVGHRLRLGPGARLDWLPQETILFDRARLRRRLDIQLHGTSELTLAESVVIGRTAMGERVRSGRFHDFWTVRRDDTLVYADALRLAEPFEKIVVCPATLHGCLAMATLLHVGAAPERTCNRLRESLACLPDVIAGVSAIGVVVVVRMLAPSAYALRPGLVRALEQVRGNRALPRNWFC